jgi:hypothetical protein
LDRTGAFSGSSPCTSTKALSGSARFSVSRAFVESAAFSSSGNFDNNDRGGPPPPSTPSYLWIAIGAGDGFLVLVIIAIVILLFVRRVPPPAEASSWEPNVLPPEEFVESFNPIAGSGDENAKSDDGFVTDTDEAAP